MSDIPRLPGDEARVTVLVAVPPAAAFYAFTAEIDRWWRSGLKYRVGGPGRSVLHLEPRVDGRLYEAVETAAGTRVVETGRVRVWEPPVRLVFEWRAVNFAPTEVTEVEVHFQPAASGTRVTLVHRGWSRLRPDHPARHGLVDAAFVRSLGLWWGELLTALREYTAAERPAE